MAKRGLVIFDLDGTLFHGLTATVPAVQQAFQELGLPPPDPHEIQFFIGKTTESLHAWLSSRCPPALAGQIVAAVDRYELDLVSQKATLYPGIPEALEEIRAFAGRMAVCTNGYDRYVEQVITTYHLQPFFDRIRYRRSDGDTKVSMVRELLAQFPERPAIVVGDRCDDIEAAHQNGLAAVGVGYGYGSAEELATADVSVSSPAALPAALRALLV